jgi:hypothetical protein
MLSFIGIQADALPLVTCGAIPELVREAASVRPPEFVSPWWSCPTYVPQPLGVWVGSLDPEIKTLAMLRTTV